VLGRSFAMNAIVFAAKRVFHRAVYMAGTQLNEVARGLTAARMDMMYALTRRGDDDRLERRSAYQSELRRLLGVSAPVVSRMLRSLEALGWISRRRVLGDRRRREVSLTDTGFASFCRAYHLIFHFAKRVVHRAICWGRHGNRNERFRHMSTLEQYLDSLRRYFRDTARLYYRWGHPDD
jgi:DNA-binding MarR family transcriptional regulator